MIRDSFPSPVGEVLERVFSRLGVDTKIRELQVLRAWSEIVGRHLNKHSKPVSIRKGNLFVKVDSSAWLAQITYFKEKIISEINRREGREVVKDIYLRVGKVSSPHTHYRRKRTRLIKTRLTRKDQKWIEEVLAKVKDESLRRTIQRVLIKDRQLKNFLSKKSKKTDNRKAF